MSPLSSPKNPPIAPDSVNADPKIFSINPGTAPTPVAVKTIPTVPIAPPATLLAILLAASRANPPDQTVTITEVLSV